MMQPKGKKVFRAVPRALPPTKPATRSSVLHGSETNVQPQQELYRLLIPVTGLLKNGTVFASGDGKLLLELREQAGRTLQEIELKEGTTNIPRSFKVKRGQIMLLISESEFMQLDFSFQLVEELEEPADA